MLAYHHFSLNRSRRHLLLLAFGMLLFPLFALLIFSYATDLNFTASAVVNNGNSIELLPGAVFDTGTGPITSELVTVIAATTGHRFIAREM